MARIKRGVMKMKHRRKVMKLVKGFRMARSRNYRVANEALLHSLSYAFRDRRVRKRDFRSLWISRINAAARLNRKALADLAVSDQAAFDSLLAVAKAQLETKASDRVAS